MHPERVYASSYRDMLWIYSDTDDNNLATEDKLMYKHNIRESQPFICQFRHEIRKLENQTMVKIVYQCDRLRSW